MPYVATPWTRQPDLPVLNLNHELLTGATVQALLVGTSSLRRNLADKVQLVSNGSIPNKLYRSGVGFYTSGIAGGDLGASIASTGSSLLVDFWHGYYLGGGEGNNSYILGDYDGANGGGVTTRHSAAGGNWGWFDGSAIVNSGETFPVDSLQTLVRVRFTLAGSSDNNLYLNGVLKISAANGATSTDKWAIGSIGQNQYGSFGSPSLTLLAGRLRFKAWDAGQVRRFTANPWQIFAPVIKRRRRAIVPAAAASGNFFSFNPPLRGGMRQGGGFFQG